MSAFDQFKIAGKASEGRKVPLTTPDGTPTDHWLAIRSRWAPEFAEAEAKARRRVAMASDEDRLEVAAEAKLDALVALVADWSDDQECTPENVRKFLKDAPQIAEKIDRMAGDDAYFFGRDASN